MKRILSLLFVLSLLLTAPSCRRTVLDDKTVSGSAEISRTDTSSEPVSVSSAFKAPLPSVVSSAPESSRMPTRSMSPAIVSSVPPPPPAPEPIEKIEEATYNLKQTYTRALKGVAAAKDYPNIENRHCYNTLSPEDKMIYDKINEAALRLQIQINDLPPKDKADGYYYVLEAYMFDRPEVFWLKPWLYYSAMPSGSNYFIQLYYDLEFNFQGGMFLHRDQHVELVDRAAKEIEHKSTQISAELEKSAAILKSEDGEYERERKLHDWLLNRLDYDYDALTDRESRPYCDDVYGGLILGSAVCVGYTHAMNLLLRNAGVDCMAVGGYADSEQHMWSLVKIDGDWYQLDATWNDWVVDGKQYIGRIFFNITDSEMLSDRSYNEYYVYNPPACNAIKYNFFIYEELYFTAANPASVSNMERIFLKAEDEEWAFIPVKLGENLKTEDFFSIYYMAVQKANLTLKKKIDCEKGYYYNYYDPWRVLYCFSAYY